MTQPDAAFDPVKEITAGWIEGLELPPEQTVSTWADTFRVLSPEASSEPGRWRTDRTPYHREPMDTVSGGEYEMVVLMWSSQTGKTELLLNVLGYLVHYDPCPILVVQPTEQFAGVFQNDRLNTMIRDSPVLLERCGDPDARGAGYKAGHIAFPGGQMALVGANAPAGLAGRPVRAVVMDEIDRYPVSAGREGDPVSLATQRTENFPNRVIVLTSTPTIKGASRIEAAYLDSDQRHYEVPCQHCQHPQRLTWSGVQWPAGQPDKARYHCCECGTEWSEAERRQSVAKGKWKAEKPGAKVAGFHLNSLASPWASLPRLAREFLAKKDNPLLLQTFVNLKLGEPFEDAVAAAATPSILMARAEEFAPDRMPEQACFVTCGVDVQHDRLEAQVVAWGIGDESWSLENSKLHGSPFEPGVWEQLEEYLLRRFPHPLGGDFGIEAAAIDSGDGNTTQAVYEFCKKHNAAFRPWHAIKGVAGDGKPLWRRSSQKSPGMTTQLCLVGVDSAKAAIYKRYAQKNPGEGYIHFPTRYPLEYYEQMCVEKVRVQFNRGFPKREWYKPDGARNEAIDTFAYAMAARHSQSPDFEGRMARLREPRAEANVDMSALAGMFK